MRPGCQQAVSDMSYAGHSIRRAKALGYGYEARPRGLIQATQVAFVWVARPFNGQAGVVIATTT